MLYGRIGPRVVRDHDTRYNGSIAVEGSTGRAFLRAFS
jgi:hypothetical protein